MEPMIEMHTKFRLATNIIVSSMLILGGSATVTDLTGMSTIAVSDNPKKKKTVFLQFTHDVRWVQTTGVTQG
jgi:hypothetical protein